MDTNSDDHAGPKKFRRLRRVSQKRRSDEEMVPPEGQAEGDVLDKGGGTTEAVSAGSQPPVKDSKDEEAPKVPSPAGDAVAGENRSRPGGCGVASALQKRRSKTTAKGVLVPVSPAKRCRTQEPKATESGSDISDTVSGQRTDASRAHGQPQAVTATQRPSRRPVVAKKLPLVSYTAPDSSVERLHREATSSQLWETPGESELKRVPNSFDSVKEYIEVFEPLLFEECRAQLRSVFEELCDYNGKDPHIRVLIKTVSQRERGWYDVTVLPVDYGAKQQLLFKEGDIAVISTPKPGSGSRRRARLREGEANNVETCRVSGTVRKFVPVDTREPLGAIVHFYSNDEAHLGSVLRQLQQSDGGWYLTLLGSLTTTQREYTALHRVQDLHSLMVEAILRPRPELFPSHNQQRPPAMPDCFTPAFLQHLQNQFNGPQLEAIQWAAAHTAAGFTGPPSNTAKQEPWPFTLVQGPPGTGKTHTVWGMLNVIHLVQYQRYYATLMQKLAPCSVSASQEPSTSNAATGDCVSGSLDEVLLKMDRSLSQNSVKLCPKPRMLVCAPSNAATDELLSRVHDRGFMDGEMKIYRPDVARVGSDSQSQAAQAVSVERRTEQLLNRSREDVVGWLQQLRVKELSVSSHIALLKKDLLDIAKSLRGPATIGMDPEILAARDQARSAHTAKLQQLAAALEEHDKVVIERSRLQIVEDQQRGESKDDARRKLEASFANEAEIVFTTVSSTGRRLFSELTHGFDMIVIDEAAQASEVAVLPPLTLRSSRCVLVGDPQQLPATVISHVANNMQYSRSLFERFQKAGCPATVLTVQYRMHPEIRVFPSEHFYGGCLTDSESIRASPSEIYHFDPLLRPYLFFDINTGRESHGGSVSYQNTLEAQVVVRLYNHLQQVLKIAGIHESAVSVGIITPYKQQLSCLQKEFQAVVGAPAKNKGVYINTVDAFQGQERDVIIMSCVRASSHGVGFVADIRRMNVALTRARRSLLVIGNANALSQSEDWTALIENARSRSCFIPADFSQINGLLPESQASGSGIQGGLGPPGYRRASVHPMPNARWDTQPGGPHGTHTADFSSNPAGPSRRGRSHR